MAGKQAIQQGLVQTNPFVLSLSKDFLLFEGAK
jgi:hypothetical protein